MRAIPKEAYFTRIIEWYQHYHGEVCVSFSGGKDSTVLLHIARKIYPDIPAVFSNTGLEYAAIQKFVRSWDNVDIIVPEMRFDRVIKTYGYPIIGKEVAEAIYYARRIISSKIERGQATVTNHRREFFGKRTTSSRQAERETEDQLCKDNGARNGEKQTGVKSQFNKEKWRPLAIEVPVLISNYCCFKMKKSPMHKYQTERGYKPILATLAEESRVRTQGWIRTGCNAFDSNKPKSQPMSFWTEQDVLAYIVEYGLDIASVYGEIVSVGTDGNCYPPTDICGNVMENLKCTGCQRTGCVYCGFGAHHDKESRFLLLKKLEPKKYDFAMSGGEWADNPAYDPTAPKMDGDWKNWNPKKIWVPKGGLGLAKVYDMVNEIYGKGFIVYE